MYSLLDTCVKYIAVRFVKELFESIDNYTVANFIRETYFYNQL